MQQQLINEEGGREKWQQFVAWVEAPPRRVTTPHALSVAEASEAAAFDAYLGATGIRG